MNASLQRRQQLLQRGRQRLVACASAKKHKVVFLGTPEVAAQSLQTLLEASKAPDATFEVCMVVSQPGKPKGRGNKAVPVPSPVEQLARDHGFGNDQILVPIKARDEAFLAALAEAAPDLAVTAAYGNMLPQRFLDTPRLGTLNIHPSLLPRYRGAAPVQRALEEGVAESGVSVAYTVLECDAGPLLAQERVAVDPDIQAPELLQALFARGSRLLLGHLPHVWAGQGPSMAVPQDGGAMTHAPKLRKEDASLRWSRSARELHNQVRAFAGWPGTVGSFSLHDAASGTSEALEVKVVKTRAAAPAAPSGSQEGQAAVVGEEVRWQDDMMLVPCGASEWLAVTHVQPPTKKVLSVKEFKNGLRGRTLRVAQA